METNTIHTGDCFDVLSELPPESVHAVVSDPPYNLSKGEGVEWEDKNWSKTNEEWDDFTIQDYADFTQKWLQLCKSKIKKGGCIVVFGTYHNIGHVNVTLQELDFTILNEIVWYKRNAFPNLSTTRLTASHETILWAYKGNDKNYTFNYEWAKKTNWPSDSNDMPNKQVRSVWNIPTSSKGGRLDKHPTQKPRQVMDRLIKLFTKPGDVVLDPFAGSGTTLKAAKGLNRQFIGIEQQPKWADVARVRVGLTPDDPSVVRGDSDQSGLEAYE